MNTYQPIQGMAKCVSGGEYVTYEDHKAALEASERACAEMREALLMVEWAGGDDAENCPECGNHVEDNDRQHAKCCPIAKALSSDAGNGFVRREVLEKIKRETDCTMGEIEEAFFRIRQIVIEELDRTSPPQR